MSANAPAIPKILCARPLAEDDGLLIARAQAGEREAFDILLARYRDRIVNLAYSLLYSRDDAEDAAQEVFARAFGNMHRFRGEAGLWTWLYRIAVNECLHRKRRARPQHFEIDENAEAGADTDTAGRVVLRLAVQQALDSLAPKLRVTLILREMHDLSYEEIAAALRIAPGTVRSRLAEARRLFKRAWDEGEAGGEGENAAGGGQ